MRNEIDVEIVQAITMSPMSSQHDGGNGQNGKKCNIDSK